MNYFEWLGSQFTHSKDRRARIESAGQAIRAHERTLTDAILFGVGNQVGLAEIPGLKIIGGAHNELREGLVSFSIDNMKSEDVARLLSERGIRVHVRKDDHYSGNILQPLGLNSCVRVSLCHYNSMEEVAQFLAAMRAIAIKE